MELSIEKLTINFTFDGKGVMRAVFPNGKTFTIHAWVCKPTETEEPLAVHDAMCCPMLGMNFQSYRKWRNYWCTGDKKKDMADYKRCFKAYMDWKQCTKVKPVEVLCRLEEIYGEFLEKY